MPELLCHGRETCLPSALAETNELIAKHVYAQGFDESRSKTFYGSLKTLKYTPRRAVGCKKTYD